MITATTVANAGAWRSATWLAVVARDRELVTRLCEVTPDTLRASGVEHDAYLYPWVASMRAFLRGEDVPPEMFVPAIDGTDPDRARHTPADAMHQLVHPPIVMFYHLLRRDAAKFNAALAEALTSHRSWWTADEAAQATRRVSWRSNHWGSRCSHGRWACRSQWLPSTSPRTSCGPPATPAKRCPGSPASPCHAHRWRFGSLHHWRVVRKRADARPAPHGPR